MKHGLLIAGAAALTALTGAAGAAPANLASAPDGCAIQVERNAKGVSLRASADRGVTGEYEMIADIYTPTGSTSARLTGDFGGYGWRRGGLSRIDVERENSFRATLRVYAPDGGLICQDVMRGNAARVVRSDLRSRSGFPGEGRRF